MGRSGNNNNIVGDAVITISGYGESCEPGVQSVLRNASRFAALHIVQHGHNHGQTPLYPGWKRDEERLSEANLQPIWHTDFDPSLVKSEAIVHVAPDHQVLEGAMDQLQQEMDSGYTWNTHFGVTCSTVVERVDGVWDVLVLGILPVLLLLDTLRSWFNFRRYYRTADLRAQTVVRTYPGRVYMGHVRWYMWEVFTCIQRSVYGGPALLQIPTGESASDFVLRTISTHNHLRVNLRPWLWSWVRGNPDNNPLYTGLGAWWILAFIIYYTTCAFPWWTFIMGNYRGYFWWLFVRNPWHPGWITMHAVHSIFAAWLSRMYLEFPHGTRAWSIHACLFPVYFTLSPLWLLYGRLHISKNTWKRISSLASRSDATEEKKNE